MGEKKPLRKHNSLVMMASAAKRRLSLFGMNGSRFKSVKRVLPSTEVAFMCGKNLAERLWLPDMKADAVDKNAPQLQQAVRQVSETIGTECHLLVIHMMTSKGKTSHVSSAHLAIAPSRDPP